MNSKAKNVIIMTQIEALRVLLPVVHHSHCCHMVHDFTRLRVKEIASAVVTPVTN